MEGGRGTLKQMQRNVRGCQWDWWWRAHGCGELARPRPWLWLTSSPRGLLVDVTQRALWHFSASTSLWAAATLEHFSHLRDSKKWASIYPLICLIMYPSIYLSVYPSIHLSNYIYIYPSIHPTEYMSRALSVVLCLASGVEQKCDSTKNRVHSVHWEL